MVEQSAEVTEQLDFGSEDEDAEDVPEERVERMVELEEELREMREEVEINEEEDETVKEDDRQQVTVGRIKVVEKHRKNVRVKFIAEGEEWTDTIPFPNNGFDEDTELGRLCRLCGVELEKVADLQGENIPIVWRDYYERYRIQVPETSRRSGLALFRVWWWGRRQGIDPVTVKYGGIGVTGLSLLIGGWYSLLYVNTEPMVESASMLLSLAGVLLTLFEAGTLFVSVILLGGCLLIGLAITRKILEEEVWPF